ncbi:single-stranded DNA-binding protein [Brachybacterium sp. ACRRE]|uniref:single-stranded DNA-binding protein n=1 Tax=Brachybacterium sp. ACRRE TaxID=2918184 RepID=UPI001EF1C4E8|nr:single-stranded DNA-binding protein [Brachybacterium sp. ACRRE]MCG7309688.1 single-stranded DNA-binding protein [Brachybacterium sp. ACRRE]
MAIDGNAHVIVGQLTADPELRYTQSGVAVASGTIAHNDRVYNKDAGEWQDGDPLFIRYSYWRESGENFSESHSKGDRVIAVGKFKQNNFTDKDGNERTSIELVIEEAGPSNRYATTTATRVKGNGNKASGSKQKAKAKAGASSKASSSDSQSDGDDDFDF